MKYGLLQPLSRPSLLGMVVAAVTVGIVAGIVILVVVFAAGAPIAVEAENGVLANPARGVAAAGASGGRAVIFGAATPSPTPTATPVPTSTPGGCASTVPPAGFGLTSMIFCDDFSGGSLNTTKWNTYITSKAANGSPWMAGANGGSGEDCRYDAQYFLPTQLTVSNGLRITAQRQNHTAGSCTFSWISGVISSYNHFQFAGGYVEFTMKAPPGNGIWPALWMMPGPGGTNGDNGEIDIQEGGNNPSPVNQTLAYHVHTLSSQWGSSMNTGVDLTNGFHKYGLRWVPGQSLTWFVDGAQKAQVTSAQFTIPDDPHELIIALNVANANNAGWRPVADATTPSPSVMQVSGVKVWQ